MELQERIEDLRREYYYKPLIKTRVLLFAGIDFGFAAEELFRDSRNSYHFASFVQQEDITVAHFGCYALELMFIYSIVICFAGQHNLTSYLVLHFQTSQKDCIVHLPFSSLKVPSAFLDHF